MKLNWNPPKVSRQRAVYRWSAPHAVYVHEGAVLNNGTVLPARRWTDYAIANTPIPQVFASEYQISGSLDGAFRLLANRLDDAFRLAIESPIWDWPRSTKRSNGETVFTPRDIVDQGTLRDSQSFRLEVNLG